MSTTLCYQVGDLVVNVVRKLGGRVEVANREEGGAQVRLVVPLGALTYDREARP